MKEINHDRCAAFIGSVTQAMRVQEILSRAAIPTTVIKNDTLQEGSRGCIYGIGFSCVQRNNVQTVLYREKIRVKQWTIGN